MCFLNWSSQLKDQFFLAVQTSINLRNANCKNSLEMLWNYFNQMHKESWNMKTFSDLVLNLVNGYCMLEQI